MTNEEIYDMEIAPALMKICQRCAELGFPFVASVEWERAEFARGRTEFCPKADTPESRPTSAQLLIHYAARCNGNVDSLIFAVMKGAREYGHSSACLFQLGVPLQPEKTNATGTSTSN